MKNISRELDNSIGIMSGVPTHFTRAFEHLVTRRSTTVETLLGIIPILAYSGLTSDEIDWKPITRSDMELTAFSGGEDRENLGIGHTIGSLVMNAFTKDHFSGGTMLRDLFIETTEIQDMDLFTTRVNYEKGAVKKLDEFINKMSGLELQIFAIGKTLNVDPVLRKQWQLIIKAGFGSYVFSKYISIFDYVTRSQVDPYIRRVMYHYYLNTAKTLIGMAMGDDVSNEVIRKLLTPDDKFAKYMDHVDGADVGDIDPDANIVRNDRTVIAPMKLDLYLPEHNLAIDCNPTITHSSSAPRPSIDGIVPKNYHQMKSRKARDVGINLFHIFGYEWSNYKEIVESMIRNRLGKNTHKLYARDLEIEEVSFDESNSFLLDNHILGQTSARLRYGLYDGDELVSLMCFTKPRYTMGYHKEYSENTWELSRFCSLLNTNVLGGASKLFKHFLDVTKPDLVISFSSLSDTTGSVYEILGFKQEAEVDPGYVWVDVKTDVAYNRASCQKRLLPKLLDEPDLDIENQTEDEIMESHGFVKVYNSGLIRWVYR